MRITYLATSLFLLMLISIILPVDVLAKAPKRYNFVGVECARYATKKKNWVTNMTFGPTPPILRLSTLWELLRPERLLASWG